MNRSESERQMVKILSSVGKNYYLLIDVNLENGQYDKLLNIAGKPEMVYQLYNYDQAMKADVCMKVSESYQAEMIEKFSIAGLKEQLQNKDTFEFEYQRNEEKKEKWVRISANAVKREEIAGTAETNANRVTEVVIGFSDITRERAAELETRKREKRLLDIIEAQNEQLKENLHTANHTNYAKTRFLANLTHEMRASVNAIMGMTEIAQKNYENADLVKEILDNMRLPIENLASMLNHVTDVRTIESGKTSAQNSSVSIKEIIKECCEILHTECEKKNHNLRIFFQNIRHEMIITDEVRLKQILNNVLSNAIQYTPEHGTVTLEVTELSSPGKKGCRYCISIEDNGIGMSKTFLNTIFEPFSKSKEDTEKVGIGLSVVKNLTELLGGTVEINSCLGKGTKVALTFRFQYEETMKKCEKSGKQDNLIIKKYDNLKGKKLLLVEDERIHRQILVYMLEEQGAVCDWANDGEEALEKLKVSEDGFYKGIITDIRLPGMKGDELTRRLRESAREYLRSIPVIAVSADAMTEDMNYYMKSGISKYLTKPVVPEHLYQVLNLLL